MEWIVLGASGFVGSAVVAELRSRGIAVREVAAPRFHSDASSPEQVLAEASLSDGAAAARKLMARAFAGAQVVVNAAGLATPGDAGSPALTGANALLPVVAAMAAADAGVPRMVHLSSAAVQGHRAELDESADRTPFSGYSRSKALGEESLALLAASTEGVAPTETVVLRATSVQGPQRPTTAALARLAASPLASVAAPGTAATPVSSINALAWFTAETGLFAGAVPGIVLQPWEGMTVSAVLEAAGGKRPLVLPRWLTRATVSAGYALSTVAGGRLHGAVRRVELMWFGQSQRPGWAELAGLRPQPSVQQVLQQARQARA
ncbi:NAD-dependent epimerase/dehydratase family protein [Pseudarthrobacter sp. P1]|uniref:NAD-dependent epimerase/dehydratase family protein n=1 Tax=Pseudarthrobacter sp. P1 TaxID=3418418 RepID=UPI003CF5F64B